MHLKSIYWNGATNYKERKIKSSSICWISQANFSKVNCGFRTQHNFVCPQKCEAPTTTTTVIQSTLLTIFVWTMSTVNLAFQVISAEQIFVMKKAIVVLDSWRRSHDWSMNHVLNINLDLFLSNKIQFIYEQNDKQSKFW